MNTSRESIKIGSLKRGTRFRFYGEQQIWQIGSKRAYDVEIHKVINGEADWTHTYTENKNTTIGRNDIVPKNSRTSQLTARSIQPETGNKKLETSNRLV